TPPISLLFPYTTLFRSAAEILRRDGTRLSQAVAGRNGAGALSRTLQLAGSAISAASERPITDNGATAHHTLIPSLIETGSAVQRSEEHTSELQSRSDLV